jgi:hypothetical protein
MTITNISQEGPTYTFTINTAVCFVNALRRTILSSIPTFVFETTPDKENKLNIEINTTRLNNEIIKQRFSNIPIHISDITTPVESLEIHIDKKNTTENLINVTTEDIKIYDTNTQKYVGDTNVKKIFPPNDITGDYIVICRLRPRINDEIPGEHFKCKSTISMSTASVLGCYNVAHTCVYAFDKDIQTQESVWGEIKNTIVTSEDTPEIEALKKKNWLLGEGMKLVKPNIFNFKLETIGVFSNLEIIRKAFSILIDLFKTYQERNDYIIEKTPVVIENSYDIQIEDNYTVGYILQYMLYRHFHEKEKILSFVGFKKLHPHDPYSVIRLAFNSKDSNEETAISLLKRSSELIINYLQDLDSKFI